MENDRFVSRIWSVGFVSFIAKVDHIGEPLYVFLKELIHIYEMEIDSYKDSLPTKEIISLDFIPLIAAQLLKRKCRFPRVGCNQ